ncbi:MAG: hypothetical protein NC132_04460 [Corallococcus sp.]|nr:hypothetical protein [Corallococcus sp.]MCM1359914.1 hypothetical protein [Corallococcus sp.]MCM1395347.1 hypothetical protein [Corallococcus sp.]
MKKSTVLILLIVFVLSVVIVGIFGMKIMSYNVKVYIDRIVPTQVVLNDGNNTVYTYYPDGSDAKNQIRVHPSQPNTYYVFVPYEDGLTVVADYEILPNDATNRNLKIVISYDSKGGVVGEGGDQSNSASLRNNVITFKQKADIVVTFRSTDGSNAIMNLLVYME